MAGPTQLDLVQERHDRVERCWMCGIRLPAAQLIPDGGSACADIRWYCRDLRACTGRWTLLSRPQPDGAGEVVGGSSGAAAS